MLHYPSKKGYKSWNIGSFEDNTFVGEHLNLEGKVKIYMEDYHLMGPTITRDKDGYYIDRQMSLLDKQKRFGSRS